MQAMKTVNISGNGSSVFMDNNNITKLPEGIFKFEKPSGITHLFLNNNFVSELPGGLFNNSGLVKLTNLIVHHNTITHLKPDQFISLQNLKILDLSYNRIQYMEPTVFKGLLNLTALWLEGNKITDLKFNQFAFLPKLKSLFLRNNEIRNVEPGAFMIQNGSLKFIDLDFNHITAFLDDLFQGHTLTNLHGINLRYNNLCMIPKCIFTSGLFPF